MARREKLEVIPGSSRDNEDGALHLGEQPAFVRPKATIVGKREQIERSTCCVPFALGIDVHALSSSIAGINDSATKNLVVQLQGQHHDKPQDTADQGCRTSRS